MIFSTIRIIWSGIFGCSVSYELERIFVILLPLHLPGKSEEKSVREWVKI